MASPFFNSSFSVSLLFFSFVFLLVFPFCFLLFLVFLSFFPFLSSLLLFHERNNIKTLNCNCFHQYFPFLFPVLFFLSNPFFLSLHFPDFKLWFLFNINVFGWKNQSWNTPISGQKGGCNKTFFMNLCFAKCEKLSFVCPSFWPLLVDVHKKHCENRYFSTILKAKKEKPFWGVIIWAKQVLLSGSSWLQLLKWPTWPRSCARNFSSKQVLKPLFYSVFWQTVFGKKANLAQIIIPQKAKLGPDNNTTAYIYIYIYTHTHLL